jgi:hypothetical protein
MSNSIVKLLDKTNFKFNPNRLKLFFKDLTLDNNDKILFNLEPFRARKIIFMRYKSGKFSINKNKKSFSQDVSDKRKYKRRFTILSPNKKELLIICSFLQKFLNLINKEQPIAHKSIDITVHFVKILASKKGQTNSPEGVHRDGYDVLMPCFVVERKNIRGGISRFFQKNKCIYKKKIKNGQGLFIFENKHKNVYHDVSPIYSVKNNNGYRCIVGVDINYTSDN